MDQVLHSSSLSQHSARLRDGKVTVVEWKQLMSQTETNVHDLSPFASALYLIPTVEGVVEHNVSKVQYFTLVNNTMQHNAPHPSNHFQRKMSVIQTHDTVF